MNKSSHIAKLYFVYSHGTVFCEVKCRFTTKESTNMKVLCVPSVSLVRDIGSLALLLHNAKVLALLKVKCEIH